jgi:ABC-type multidrug transport system ATPase subunit
VLGKSSLLKALAGQLHLGGKTFDGAVTFNGDTASSGRFKLPKIADYIDEKDQHAPTLSASHLPLSSLLTVPLSQDCLGNS